MISQRLSRRFSSARPPSKMTRTSHKHCPGGKWTTFVSPAPIVSSPSRSSPQFGVPVRRTYNSSIARRELLTARNEGLLVVCGAGDVDEGATPESLNVTLSMPHVLTPRRSSLRPSSYTIRRSKTQVPSACSRTAKFAPGSSVSSPNWSRPQPAAETGLT